MNAESELHTCSDSFYKINLSDVNTPSECKDECTDIAPLSNGKGISSEWKKMNGVISTVAI